uniref:Putative tick salivary antigen-5 protein n=1 Tax=Rhipicephalus pulchellus TaxID=72859 RepID=L7MBI6_RHIPC
MKLSASLAVGLLIAALCAPAFSKKGGEGGGGGEPEDSEDYEPEDFKGVFTRAMKKVQRQVRRRHNEYRRRHNAEPLESDDELDRYAQAWAYHLAKIGRVMHRRSRTYGENIYQGQYDADHPIRGRDAVDTWYNEIQHYDFNKNHRQRGTRAFTQVVWKKTSALGTGIARGKDGTYFLVTVYDPRGNIRGKYLKNVERPNQVGGETHPQQPHQPGPVPVPVPAPVPTPAPVPIPAPQPMPTPPQAQIPTIGRGGGGVTINGQNVAGKPLFKLNGCPGNKPITLNLKVGPK